jgi:hypothetical protein
MASDYFLCGRVTYELLSRTWAKIKGGPYLDRMNSIPKLVASRTLTEPLEWNATLIKGDVAEEIAKLKQEPGKDIEMYGSAVGPPLRDRRREAPVHRGGRILSCSSSAPRHSARVW